MAYKFKNNSWLVIFLICFLIANLIISGQLYRHIKIELNKHVVTGYVVDTPYAMHASCMYSYKIKGAEYTNQGYSCSHLKKGDAVNIFYNIDNPKYSSNLTLWNALYKYYSNIFLICFIVSSFFTIIYISKIKKESNERKTN